MSIFISGLFIGCALGIAIMYVKQKGGFET